jgi:hypothetical protein
VPITVLPPTTLGVLNEIEDSVGDAAAGAGGATTTGTVGAGADGAAIEPPHCATAMADNSVKVTDAMTDLLGLVIYFLSLVSRSKISPPTPPAAAPIPAPFFPPVSTPIAVPAPALPPMINASFSHERLFAC